MPSKNQKLLTQDFYARIFVSKILKVYVRGQYVSRNSYMNVTHDCPYPGACPDIQHAL
jgi:hypothetical protein